VPQKYFDQYPVDGVELPKILESDLEDVPAAGVKMAKPDGDDRKVRESDNHKLAVQGYLASIAFADAQVGRLLEALDNGPHADNTIVILWGDHGWHLGEKHHWRKFSLWEEAARAPLMMTVPGVTKPGGASPRAVSFMDIYPTLADLCGLPIGDHLEGKSLRPLLENPQAKWDRPALTTHGRNNHAVRSERWRYIRYADGSEELYDHESDPLEWKNLADDEQYASVKKELSTWLPKKNAPDAAAENDQPKRRGRNAKEE
jgi:arylsulfatase A-like enzyme